MAKSLSSEDQKLMRALWSANLGTKLVSFLESKLVECDMHLRNVDVEPSFRYVQGKAKALTELINDINVGAKLT